MKARRNRIYLRPYCDARGMSEILAYERKASQPIRLIKDTIVTSRTPDGRWMAIDSNQYDGFGPIGYGDTPREARTNLLGQMG